jgi:hypothetical protein
MAGRPTVVIELAADAQHARDLSAGGVFVPGCALALNSDCELVVRGAGQGGELHLDARVVFLDPGRGAGLELVGFGPELKEQLATLAAPAAAAAPPPPDELDDWAAEWASDEVAVIAEGAAIDADAGAPGGAPALAVGSGELDVPADDAGEPAPGEPVQQRLRHLPLAQQIKRAHSAELHERILLERMYGKNVWEALLRNPRLTAPEVARIARVASLPRPLIEIIVGNGAWLQIPEVRRALLANPRLGTDQILRVLRLLSKHELKLVAVQTSYPYPVRDAARRLLRDA